MPSSNACVTFSPDSENMVTIGDSGTHLNFYETRKFDLLLKVFLNGSFAKKIQFSHNNQELLVLTNDCKIKVYGLNRSESECQVFFIKEFTTIHREQANDFALNLPPLEYLE